MKIIVGKTFITLIFTQTVEHVKQELELTFLST